MHDSRIDKLASVVVNYCCPIKEGDLVCIAADPIAMPAIEATYEACLAKGAHPFWHANSDGLAEIMLAQGNDEQLKYLSPLDMERIEKVDAVISFWAETNTKAMSTVDPKRSALRQSARKPFMKRFMERNADKSLKWCGTLFPTQASAQDAEMSLRAYSDFVFKAGLLHLDDPAAAWQAIETQQQLVVDYLNTKKEVHFQVPAHGGHDGTDLRVNVDGGTWINCPGRENFPDGEVFAGPQGADGHVNYTFPAVYSGREVHGVRLAFKEGRVVDASATKNEEYLIEMLDQDAGARNMGEIAIGTNYGITEFSRNTLFDEKIGGTFHAAVGAGYPESGNTNESGLHWDMVCEMRKRNGHPATPGGKITADGELFHENGKFLPAGWPGNE